MKKEVKRFLKQAVAVGLSAIMLSSCGANNIASNNGKNDEMTIFMHFYGYCVYNDNWEIFKQAEKETGVKLKGVASESISDSNQAWNTMVASKQLPDIIHSSKKNLNSIGEKGALIPLEDLIEEHAPNIAKLFEEHPEIKAEATAGDGHIYYIPGSTSGIEKEAVASKGWFIRTDWLDNLGLKEPGTVDEMYNVLKAFRTQDPNGNGKMDEIPYFARQEGIRDLYQLFGAYYGWYVDENGTVKYGRTEDSFRNAVKEISKWYKENLIDPEIYTRGQQAREQLLSNNTGGMTHDWFSTTASYNKYSETIPGFTFESILPPADVNGVVKELRSRSPLHGYGWGISRDNKNPELAIKYFDFWMSEKGCDLNAFGIEGVHHEIVDGEKKFVDSVLNAEEGVPSYMRNQGQVEIGTIGDIEAELSGMNDIAKKGFLSYNDANFVKKEFTTPTFTAEEESVISEKYTNIDTYVAEKEQNWILGISDVDAEWDEYIKTINDMGLAEVEKIYNDAYKRQYK